jgi:hypothetical protein
LVEIFRRRGHNPLPWTTLILTSINLQGPNPEEPQGYSDMIAFFKNLMEKGVINQIFAHFRNLSIAALIIAAGWHIGGKGNSQYLWLISTEISGYLVISIGIILFILNIVDGLYKLSKIKYSVMLDTVLIIIYIIISIRLVKILTDFRIKL